MSWLQSHPFLKIVWRRSFWSWKTFGSGTTSWCRAPSFKVRRSKRRPFLTRFQNPFENQVAKSKIQGIQGILEEHHHHHHHHQMHIDRSWLIMVPAKSCITRIPRRHCGYMISIILRFHLGIMYHADGQYDRANHSNVWPGCVFRAAPLVLLCMEFVATVRMLVMKEYQDYQIPSNTWFCDLSISSRILPDGEC